MLTPLLESEHVVVGLNALLFTSIVCVSLFAAFLLHKYDVTFLPDSGAAMLIGMGCGGFILLFGKSEEETVLFSPEVFFFVILPPIIFEAGYTMKQKHFFSNFTSIMLFAVGGTLVSTLLIGYVLYGFAKAGAIPLESKNPLESLMFASLISAVDPVATLAILGGHRTRTDPTLYSLVFGESVLNDAVAIVLFKTFRDFYERGAGSFTDTQVVEVFFEFVGVSIGSVLVGAVVALASAYIFKKSSIRKFPAYEFTLLFFFAYGSYCVAEIIDLSGIMALFFCGILMAHYTWYNMSRGTRSATKHAFKSFALISETFLFAYLGIQVIISFRPVYKLTWNFAMIGVTIVMCLISRAFNIFPLSWLANLRRKRPITHKMQFVMWFAGLRGAIAFALALNVPAAADGRGAMITTTMTVVLFTTLVLGGYTETLIERLGLSQSADENAVGGGLTPDGGGGGGGGGGDKAGRYARFEDDRGAPGALGDSGAGRGSGSLSGGDSEPESPAGVPRGRRRIGGFHLWWKRFDNRHMKPLFGGKKLTQESLTTTADLVEFESESDEYDSDTPSYEQNGMDPRSSQQRRQAMESARAHSRALRGAPASGGASRAEPGPAEGIGRPRASSASPRLEDVSRLL